MFRFLWVFLPITIFSILTHYGNYFEVFDQNTDYYWSISFCILQIGESRSCLSKEYQEATPNRVHRGSLKGMRSTGDIKSREKKKKKMGESGQNYELSSNDLISNPFRGIL